MLNLEDAPASELQLVKRNGSGFTLTRNPRKGRGKRLSNRREELLSLIYSVSGEKYLRQIPDKA